MANVKISELTSKAVPASADEIVLVDSVGGASKKTTVGALPSGENNRTLDAVPTNGNTANSVSSDGVFDALATKSDTTHNHDSSYSATGHNHDSSYSATGHNHDSSYATTAQGTTADNALPKTGGALTGAVTTNSTFDGRDVATDGTKLDGIEASADVTDATNVAASGALMDSEVTNLAQVKAFDSSDYATAAQGTTADAALPKTGGTMTGALDFGDDVKANFGADDDLQIYHDGSNSYIDDTGTGALFLKTNGAGVFLYSGSEALATFNLNGASNLYYDNSLKLATTSSGIDVTGTAVATTDTDTSNTGSVTLDFGTNQNFVLTLTGNVTLANPSTEQVGQSGFITFIQDGIGSRTVSLGADYETAGGAGLTLTTTASATDIVPYVVIASGRILLGKPQLAFA
jgi:hypothetical protein